MNGSLKEWIGGMIVCDKVRLVTGVTSSLLSFDRSQSSLVNKTPGEEIYDS